MGNKSVSIIIASAIAIFFLFFAIKPGIFNMIGYTISILIFPENSSENLKYGKVIIYLFDILCGLILFWILYKLMNRILR
jgi:hypothetical protein